MISGTATADTGGWDIVYAFHIDEVNAAIVAAGSSPQAFVQSDQDGNRVEGRFGAWALTAGGAGPHVRLKIPLTGLVFAQFGAEPRPPMDGELAVSVMLSLSTDPAIEGRQHLVIDPAASSDKAPDLHAALHLSDSTTNEVGQIVIQALMEQWLKANLPEFDHVFASIDLGREASKGAFQWMQPTAITYAYADFEDGEDGVLALLAMTGRRPPTGLAQQVSSACVPEGQRASVVISKERFMEELVLPAMPLLFKGSKRDDFQLSGGRLSKRADHAVVAPIEHDGTTYLATVVKLEADLHETELSLTSVTEVPVGYWGWVRSRTTSVSRLTLRLECNKSGEQTLGFQDAPGSPSISHDVVKPWGFVVVEVLLGVIGAIIAIILTILSFGTAAFAIGIVVAFAIGADLVYDKWNEGDAPAIGAAMMEATASIRWPSGTGFHLESARLHGALVLAGSFRAGQ